MYQPSPINTDHITLSEDLLLLTEKIAEQVHEIWAEGRVREGWTYGETRDDKRKTTPCLVPYEDLPEEEKAYDRNTALGTIKLVRALGYRIGKDEAAAPSDE